MNIPALSPHDLSVLSLEGPPEGTYIDCVVGEYTPVPEFRLKRGELGQDGVRMPTNGIHVLVRMLQRNAKPFSKDAYQQDGGTDIECFAAAGIHIDALHNGHRGLLKMHGSLDDVNLALSGLALIAHGGVSRTNVLQVIVADGPMPVAVYDWSVNKTRSPCLLVAARAVEIRIDDCYSDDTYYDINALK